MTDLGGYPDMPVRQPTGPHPVMQPERKSSGLKAAGAVAAIVVAALTIAAALGLVLPWQAASRAELKQMEDINITEHRAIRLEVGETAGEVRKVGGDVKIIKCLMLAKTKAQRDRCALDP